MIDDPLIVRDLLIRLDTKVDMLLTRQNDHESRLRDLERMKWLVIGMATAAGGLAGKLVGLL